MMMFSWNSDDDHDFGDISSFFIVKLHPSLWFMTECLFSQYYQLCDSTLVQSRKECSCRWRKRWNIRLGWLSIGFLCFSRKYFSDSLNRISLIFLAVLGSDRAKYQIYMLSGLHWLFATNLSWKWLQVAELSWKGVNWVHFKYFLQILILRQSQMLLSDMTLDVTCASARWPDCFACARMLSSARMFSSVWQAAC